MAYRSKDELGHLADSLRMMTQNNRGYIGDLGECLSSVSHGNLTVRPTAAYQGDFIPLRDDLDNLITQLNATLG